MGAEGRYELATWFEKVLQEIEEDRLYDPDAIEDLKVSIRRSACRLAGCDGLRGPRLGDRGRVARRANRGRRYRPNGLRKHVLLR